jgi:hypothetical protein
MFARQDGGKCSLRKNSRASTGQILGNSDLLFLTRLLPSSDGKDNNLSRTSPWWSPILWPGLFNMHTSLPDQILCLFKPTAHVCTLQCWRWAEMCTLPLPVVGMNCIINLSLPFTLSLYLAYRGKWPDKSCGIQEFGPGVQNSGYTSTSWMNLCKLLNVFEAH